MKFNYSIAEIAQIVNGQLKGPDVNHNLSAIYYDTRLFENGQNALFLCLNSKRKGSDFIPAAYDKGCRAFLVERKSSLPNYTDAIFILVENVLEALQELAKYHRGKFSYPVIGITGSFGKTIIKEWLNHFLKNQFHVVRSPKSFNSQIGVALSVLQMESDHNLALFEAGISTINEMQKLEEIIQPTIGLFTGLGSAHDNGFSSLEHKLEEKAKLFANCPLVISENFNFPNSVNINWKENIISSDKQKTKIVVPDYDEFEVPFTEKHKIHNFCAVLEVLRILKIESKLIHANIASLPEISMRMELIKGKNDNVFINDSYALDGLKEALSFLIDCAGTRSQYLFIAVKSTELIQQINIELIQKEYPQVVIVLVSDNLKIRGVLSLSEAEEMIKNLNHAAVLLKGQHGSGISKLIAKYISRSHPTVLEISRQSLRNNLTQFKKCLQPETKLMVMVKAAAYGIGSFEMASFLEREGVDYLGVAFPDEGVDLRKMGVTLPIMVMNSHEASFFDVIEHNLEPAIFSLAQLDSFTSELIRSGKTLYPIHLKIETGMNRLGFREEDMNDLLNFLSSQPEILVKSVYSHLAESGNSDVAYTQLQLSRFENAVKQLEKVIPQKFIKHICNTDGIINYPEAHFDMVRLGIGLFGYAKLSGLEYALSLKTKISKINTIQSGESLGYDRSFIAPENMKIAVLPIGYADGFRRVLGNKNGHVKIDNQDCAILGNVCMDMCFADITNVNCSVNDDVELIGANITVSDWAAWANTIPYEIITSLSQRINRIWVE